MTTLAGAAGDPTAAGRSVRLGSIAYGLIAAFVFTIPFEEIVTVRGVGSITRLSGFGAIVASFAAMVQHGRVRVRSQLLFSAVALAFVLGNYVTPAITSFTVFVVRPGAFREIGRFNVNEFAIVAALGIPMAMYLLANRRRVRWRLFDLLNVVYPAVEVAAIVVGASRGGYMLVLAVGTLAALLPTNVADAKSMWFVIALFACHRPIVLSIGGRAMSVTTVSRVAPSGAASDVPRFAPRNAP